MKKMKKLITIMCAALLTFSLSAQQFGIKAGLNIAAIGTSEDGGPEDARTGMQLGALVMFELSDAVDLRTGLIYSQKGAAENDLEVYDYYYNVTKDDMIFALDYLEIPVDFAFKLGDDGFALSVGPYLGLLMSSKIKFDGEEDDIDDDIIKGMDMGLNLGASFVIDESIIIDVRYGMGLMDISDVEETNYYGYETGKDASTDVNGCLSISVGYVFGG